MLGNLENLAVAKGLQRSVFIPVPKKGKKQRRKGKIKASECRVPKNSKER